LFQFVNAYLGHFRFELFDETSTSLFELRGIFCRPVMKINLA